VLAVNGLQTCGVHPGPTAVVVTLALNPAGPPSRVGIARHDRGTALADDDEPILGENGQGMLQGCSRDLLQCTHLADRR